MCSRESLRAFVTRLLPEQGACSHTAAWELLRALSAGFTTNLCQLARQTDRETPTRAARQYLHRWLQRPHWVPEALYAQLTREARRQLLHGASQALLIDLTYLGDRWMVLQVSVGWQRRALPLYRSVTRWKDPETGQRQQLDAACTWLAQHLPGPQSRYVLVLDRGFPSHALLRTLQEAGWRYVIRLKGDWKLTHPAYQGRLLDLRD